MTDNNPCIPIYGNICSEGIRDINNVLKEKPTKKCCLDLGFDMNGICLPCESVKLGFNAFNCSDYVNVQFIDINKLPVNLNKEGRTYNIVTLYVPEFDSYIWYVYNGSRHIIRLIPSSCMNMIYWSTGNIIDYYNLVINSLSITGSRLEYLYNNRSVLSLIPLGSINKPAKFNVEQVSDKLYRIRVI